MGTNQTTQALINRIEALETVLKLLTGYLRTELGDHVVLELVQQVERSSDANPIR